MEWEVRLEWEGRLEWDERVERLCKDQRRPNFLVMTSGLAQFREATCDLDQHRPNMAELNGCGFTRVSQKANETHTHKYTHTEQ